ncbi:MAG TPA: PhoU domain-containing protein [Terriglobales bacterium]|nr:PhoU domain-containing protein [Terriglobales bacterium]
MSSPNAISFSDKASTHLVELTSRGCDVASRAAQVVADGLSNPAFDCWEEVRKFEEELDTLDRLINEEVTAGIHKVSESKTKEWLACLKFIIELERIGDLLLNVANRMETVGARLRPSDAEDLSRMASLVTSMLAEVSKAFNDRDIRRAIDALKTDGEVDRLRNLIFVRHIENRENEPRQESFHLVFISQALERAGDHVKNLAEEICHLVSGRSMRHIMREYDRPVEQVYFEKIRRSKSEKG